MTHHVATLFDDLIIVFLFVVMCCLIFTVVGMYKISSNVQRVAEALERSNQYKQINRVVV